MRQHTQTNPSVAVETWSISESQLDNAHQYLHETLFSTGNGYIGLRGCHEEGAGEKGQSWDGSYLNGFYETESIRYPEGAYGLAQTNQFMLNVPNLKGIGLVVDGERFHPASSDLSDYRRRLDFQSGVLQRELIWQTHSGKRLKVVSERVVSLNHKHLFAIRYQVTPLNFQGQIRLMSWMDGQVTNFSADNDPRVAANGVGAVLLPEDEMSQDFGEKSHGIAFSHRTRHSGFLLVSAICNQLQGVDVANLTDLTQDGRRGECWDLDVAEGEPVTLTKWGVYVSSRDYDEASLFGRAFDELKQHAEVGFDAMLSAQRDYLNQFWQGADIGIHGDDNLQQGLRFNLYHLLQSAGRDGKTNIAAKGLTGEGYEGHYFWDTEIYILPFFLYSNPSIARKLLEHRFSCLEMARKRARQMGHQQGALYPWRTIDGEECSAYFPAGTAQYHINADIAYSVRRYLNATGDMGFMADMGAEMIWDMARIWLGLGHFVEGEFHINEVTGPDEYTAMVNNNLYTNAMAQLHLEFAVEQVTQLQQYDATRYGEIAEKIGLTHAEVCSWQEAAEAMYLPYDDAKGLHPQDDSFLNKARWDLASTPEDKFPLLLHYHPLVIYRHQVCKQADVVLAMLLLSSRFNQADKKRNFDYYEQVTTHDSSLSTCIFSIVAGGIGDHQKAYDYFAETARLDLDNTHKNTHYGVHTAAMGGAWMGIVFGMAGMRDDDGVLRFAPHRPEQWQGYEFKLIWQGNELKVVVGETATEYQLISGQGVSFFHHTQPVQLSSEESTHVVKHTA